MAKFRTIGYDAFCAACGTQAVRVNSVLWRCPACQPARAAPARQPPPPKPGLGDLVAAGLKRIGITEERVKAVTGLKDCGCGRRRQALNDLGKKVGIGVDAPAGD